MSETRKPRRVDRVDLLRLLGVVVAFGVTLGGLHTILAGVTWWLFCFELVLVCVSAGFLVRQVLASRPLLAAILAPLGSVLALAIALLVTFAADTLAGGVVPTVQTVVRFQKLFRDAGYSITWQDIPADADPPILCLLGFGVAALLLVTEVCVFSLRSTALIGFPLAVIFLVPGMIPQGPTDGLFFAGSALAYLGLLLVGRSRWVIPTLAIALATVVGALVLPPILPSTNVAVTSNALGPSVSTGVNPIIRLGDDLRSNDKHVALTYSTVSGKPGYLRLVTINDFSTDGWGPNQPALEESNRPVAFPKPPGLAIGVTTGREVTYIHVANLLSPWLPVPYPATSVTGLDGSWQYVPDSFTVASNVSLARGEDYTATSVVLTPTPEQLLAAGTTVPSDLSDYLALPEDTPKIIGETAREVTAGESSNYERALAIQGFLRSSPFRYSESAPVADGYDGTGVEVVAQFLEAHRGYCIHFSSAMALMARELGIPSRMIVGFQPGVPINKLDNGRKMFEVTTQDLHSWPELYFSGIGWVRFEPTPSRGAIPDYANQSQPGVPLISGATSGPNAGQSGRASDRFGPQLDAGPTVARWLASGGVSGLIGGIGLVLLLLLVVLLPAGFRVSRRHRRIRTLRSGRGQILPAWRELVESAEDAGIVLAASLTPRQVVAKLERARGMTEATREALERFGRSVEAESFARNTLLDSKTGAALADDVLAVLKSLRDGIAPSRRARALLMPPSLVSRVLRATWRFG